MRQRTDCCPLDRAANWERNLVERFCNRLKRVRGIAARYHKLDVVYLHMIYLACIHIMTEQGKHALVREGESQCQTKMTI